MKNIKINSSFFTHHKTLKLTKRLGNDGIVSLLRLWSYAAEFRRDGKLVNMTTEDIEMIAGWTGEAEIFVSALLELRFLELEEGILSLHDWSENSGIKTKAPLIEAGCRRQGGVFAPAKKIDAVSSALAREVETGRVGERENRENREKIPVPPSPNPKIAPPSAVKKTRSPRVENGGDYEIEIIECDAGHEFDDIIKKGGTVKLMDFSKLP